ncbi:alkaline phosphatase family protein, partial [Candidatus Altiarchaeota archaeon]
KIIVIGVDGLEWDVIGPMVREGRLPNIKRLIDTGVSGNLSTNDPLISPAIWTSIATGKKTEKHGITSFLSDGIPMTSNQRKTKALWNILSDHNQTVGVVGYQITWPVEEVNGFMVSDRLWIFNTPFGHNHPANIIIPFYVYKAISYLTGLELFTSAYSLWSEHQFVDGYLFNPLHPLYGRDSQIYWHNFMVFNVLMKNHVRDRNFFELGEYLRTRNDPRVYVIYFKLIDRSSHVFWRYYQPEKFDTGTETKGIRRFGQSIPRSYEYVDEMIGQMMESNPRSTIILLSDHGFHGFDIAYECYGERSLEGDWFEHRGECGKIPWKSGVHKEPAVIIMKGPCMREGEMIDNASIYDITPTILGLTGIPVGKDMDGRFLDQAMTDECLGRTKIMHIGTHDEDDRKGDLKPIPSDDDEQIKKRLRDTGYMV